MRGNENILFKLYPELAKTGVEFTTKAQKNENAEAFFSKEENKITLVDSKFRRSRESVGRAYEGVELRNANSILTHEIINKGYARKIIEGSTEITQVDREEE